MSENAAGVAQGVDHPAMLTETERLSEAVEWYCANSDPVEVEEAARQVMPRTLRETQLRGTQRKFEKSAIAAYAPA